MRAVLLVLLGLAVAFAGRQQPLTTQFIESRASTLFQVKVVACPAGGDCDANTIEPTYLSAEAMAAATPHFAFITEPAASATPSFASSLDPAADAPAPAADAAPAFVPVEKKGIQPDYVEPGTLPLGGIMQPAYGGFPTEPFNVDYAPTILKGGSEYSQQIWKDQSELRDLVINVQSYISGLSQRFAVLTQAIEVAEKGGISATELATQLAKDPRFLALENDIPILHKLNEAVLSSPPADTPTDAEAAAAGSDATGLPAVDVTTDVGADSAAAPADEPAADTTVVADDTTAAPGDSSAIAPTDDATPAPVFADGTELPSVKPVLVATKTTSPIAKLSDQVKLAVAKKADPAI